MNDSLAASLQCAMRYRTAVEDKKLVYLMPNGNAGVYSELPPGSRVICVGFWDSGGRFESCLMDFGKKAP